MAATSEFTDSDAVRAIQTIDVVSGKPSNLYDPQGLTTRAEVAMIFNRFILKIAK
jgi:hypothetical protein